MHAKQQDIPIASSGRPITIIPAILSESLSEAQQMLDTIQEMNGSTVVHLDMIDAQFGDALTISPADTEELSWGSLQVDMHLMVDEPVDYVVEATLLEQPMPIRTVLGQIEHMSYQGEFVAEVKKHGWRAGLSLNVYTPLEAIEQEVWHHVDVLQIMGVPAGEQGQPFHPSALGVLQELGRFLSAQSFDQEIEIMIDGGVREHLVDELCSCGVTSIVVGSSLWHQTDPKAEYQAYRDLVAACRAQ